MKAEVGLRRDIGVVLVNTLKELGVNRRDLARAIGTQGSAITFWMNGSRARGPSLIQINRMRRVLEERAVECTRSARHARRELDEFWRKVSGAE